MTNYIDIKPFSSYIKNFELYSSTEKQLFMVTNIITKDIFFTVIYEDEHIEIFNEYELAVKFYNNLF